MAKETQKRNTRGMDPDTRKQFGEWLRTARKQMGMRQEDLAQRVGVDQGTVSLWESGEIFPGAENLRELSKTFEVPIEAFYGDESHPDEETSPGYMPRVRVVGEIVLSRHTSAIEMVSVDDTSSEVHLLGASLVGACRRNPKNEVVMLRVRGRGASDYNDGELVMFERTGDESLLRPGDVVIVGDPTGNRHMIQRYSQCDGSGFLHSIHSGVSVAQKAYSIVKWTRATKLWGVEVGRVLLHPSGHRRRMGKD